MLVVFCVFYSATLIATGYISWVAYQTDLYKCNWLILGLLILYHIAIYHFEPYPITLLILAITYGFTLFEILFYLSKWIVDNYHNQK